MIGVGVGLCAGFAAGWLTRLGRGRVGFNGPWSGVGRTMLDGRIRYYIRRVRLDYARARQPGRTWPGRPSCSMLSTHGPLEFPVSTGRQARSRLGKNPWQQYCAKKKRPQLRPLGCHSLDLVSGIWCQPKKLGDLGRLAIFFVPFAAAVFNLAIF